MRNAVLQKSSEITVNIVSRYYPNEMELWDVIWEIYYPILEKWIETDANQYTLLNIDNGTRSGLSFVGPEMLKLATIHIITIVPAVLGDLLAHDHSTPDDVKSSIVRSLKLYGNIFASPIHILKHLENTLPELLLKIPEDLADEETCRKVLPNGIMEEITIRKARILPFKSPEYRIFINRLNRKRPFLYLDGQILAARAKAIQILASLLKKDGKVCTYEEIIEDIWGMVMEKLPEPKQDKLIETLERTINQGLRKISNFFLENILTEMGGYRVKRMKYCIIER